MAFKLSAADTVLGQFTGRVSNGILSSCWMGLLKSAPADDGTGFIEQSGNGYLRALIGISRQSATQKMSAAVDRHTENKEIIYFPEAVDGSWSGLPHWALFETETGGTPEMWGPLTGGPITIPVGYMPLFRVGTFEMDLA